MADSALGSDSRAGAESGVLDPIVVNRAPRALGQTLRVVAFNAKGCARPKIVAERLRRPPLADASVILLSEADWRMPRSAMRETVAELAEALSMSLAFAPEFAFANADQPFSGFFGNAILSAVPLSQVASVSLPKLYDWVGKRLPGNPRYWRRRIGQRGGLTARITLAGRNVTVGVMHLENHASPAGRADQVAHFLRAMPLRGPAIVGGDFNTTTIDLSGSPGRARMAATLMAKLMTRPWRMRVADRYEPLFAELARTGFSYRAANSLRHPTFTPAALLPRALRPRLDWIALREVEPIAGSGQVVSAASGLFRRISDHDFVVCEVAL